MKDFGKKKIPTERTYPDWTVEQCICSVGHFREDCPYAVTGRLDTIFAEKEMGIAEKDVLELDN